MARTFSGQLDGIASSATFRHPSRGHLSSDQVRKAYTTSHSRQDTGLRIDSTFANSLLKTPTGSDDGFDYRRDGSISPLPSPSKDPAHKLWGRPPPYSAVIEYGDWRKWDWFEERKGRLPGRNQWKFNLAKRRIALIALTIVVLLCYHLLTRSKATKSLGQWPMPKPLDPYGVPVDDRDYAEDLGVDITHEHRTISFRNAAEHLDQRYPSDVGGAKQSRESTNRRFNPAHYENQRQSTHPNHHDSSVERETDSRLLLDDNLATDLDEEEDYFVDQDQPADNEEDMPDEILDSIEQDLIRAAIPPNMVNDTEGQMSKEAIEAERKRRMALPRRHRFGARLQDLEDDRSDLLSYADFVLETPALDVSLSRLIDSLTIKQQALRLKIQDIYLKQDKSQEPMCGNWADSYAAMHHDVLSGKKPGQFISYICEEGSNCGGLADRMLGITSAFLLALLTDRVFLMEWQSPASIDTFFDVGRIDWTYNPKDESHPAYNFSVVNRAQDLDTIHLPKEYLDKIFNETLWEMPSPQADRAQTTKLREKAFGSPWIKYYTNRGIAIRSFRWSKVRPRLDSLQLKRHMTYGCIIDYLFRPKAQAMAYIAQYASIMKMPNVFSIGIQIRTGDASMADDEHDQSNTVELHWNFFECASQMAETYALPGQRIIYFLVTDSARLRADAVSKLGDRVIVSGLSIEHVHKRAGHLVGVHHAIMEEWILATTDYRIITQNSGFGKVASFTSGKEFTTIQLEPVSTLLSKKKPSRPNCRNDQLLRGFSHIADYWSLG